MGILTTGLVDPYHFITDESICSFRNSGEYFHFYRVFASSFL